MTQRRYPAQSKARYRMKGHGWGKTRQPKGPRPRPSKIMSVKKGLKKKHLRSTPRPSGTKQETPLCDGHIFCGNGHPLNTKPGSHTTGTYLPLISF
eukprot:1159641-Pelagomonas_calceolata.AAC.17